jgi:MoaA/NifB/PqqE/SkfB family radical SAM enzyme
LIYRFPNIKQYRKLGVAVENEDNRLKIRVSGPKAFLFQHFFKYYFKVYNSMDPVAVHDGSYIYTLYVPPIPSEAHARHFEDFIRRWRFGTRIPLAVTISVTNRCQLSCEHCSVPAGESSGPELSTEEFKRIIAQCLDLGTTNITFTGGEPLLFSGLEELLTSIPREKAVALVFTNALALSEQRARSLKEAGAWGIQVSLDSPDPEEHDRFRAAGSFETVEKGVKAARKAGLLVGLSTYATNESVQKKWLSRIVERGASWGVQEVSVFDIIPTGRLLHHEEVILSFQNRKSLIEESQQLRKKYSGKLHVITQSWTNSKKGFARFIGCLAGNYQFHISASGGFRPCDFTPFSMGNVRTESLEILWKRITTHPSYRKHRHACRMQCPTFRKEHIDHLGGRSES